ncbi:MAG: N-6 DNA methylase [Flavobacteriales bacterium]|nr:N-6 DNA methylase [Flavobacteriales bacterium]
MSSPAIDKYYTSVQKIRDYGGSGKETAIRSAFYTLLNHYAEKKDLILITELSVEGKLGRKVTPDGTLKNALRLDYGYWESKDEADDIDEEIEKKFKKGYPDRNILFEDSQTAVLIQEGREVMRVPFKDADKLDGILNAFVNHKHPEARKFEEALDQFKTDLPTILETLRDKIETARKQNAQFIAASEVFWTLCKAEINPDITEADIREMMIQHILTADIFNKIFDEPDFHQHNNMGQQLEALIGTLFSYSDRKNLLAALEHYYEVINAAAAGIKDHHEKQQFLKVLYENFYKVYNPKMADRLGVVYTPNEIVRFMIRSTDQLLHRHFGKTLSSKNVEILDPATGTGTFLTDIIDHIPKQDLDYKYKNEMHANEVAILPYYVANLNIEYTFKQKMGYYAEFPNLCFVDTLDNTGALQFSGKQEDMFGLNSVNATRIKNQNSKKISVIIGNPPYNANQQNENDNNKNREYTFIDKRIKETYAKRSRATNKANVYDMYTRFYRWAMDRVDRNGIIAFVTNRSYIDGKALDGFRATVKDEFTHAYVIDTHSDVRDNPKISGTKHNVFGIQTGVAICFLIRQEKKTGPCRIQYIELSDQLDRAEKLDWFRSQEEIGAMPFAELLPDVKDTWVEQAGDEFNALLPTIEHDARPGVEVNALFTLHSLGINTNRDEWLYDFSESDLVKRMRYFTTAYNDLVQRGDRSYPDIIKWSSSLKDHLLRGTKGQFSKEHVRGTMYRPFTRMYHYTEKLVNHRLTDNHYQMFGKGLDQPNPTITFITGTARPFSVMAVRDPFDMNFVSPAAGGTHALPLYRYGADGMRHDNLTDWGLERFRIHYGNKKISKEQVFQYAYAVFHDPQYRAKYERNLKRDFPRVPLYPDFTQWSKWGKELMDLHINFETVQLFPLEAVRSRSAERQKEKKQAVIDGLIADPMTPYGYVPAVKVKLKADKEAGIIELDELTLLKGIPKEAWAYKLGNRSALEWVLDQYKEKTPKDPTIREKFNTYRFADYKEKVIDLLKRVTTVSVGSMEVVRGMEAAIR